MVPMDLFDAGLPQNNLWKNTSVPCVLPLRLAHWLPAPPGSFPAPSGYSSGAVPEAEIKHWAFEVVALTPRSWATRELTLGSITKETTWIQDPASPTTSSTLCRMPHLNNKQNTNPVIIRQDYHLTQPSSEEKQTNKQTKTQHKSHPIQSLQQTTGPTLEGQKPKGRKNSTLKPEKRRPQTQ